MGKFLRLFIFSALVGWGESVTLEPNDAVLHAVNSMPSGGVYSRENAKMNKTFLKGFTVDDDGRFVLSPQDLTSDCGTGTYFPWLKSIQELRDRGQIVMTKAEAELLLPYSSDGLTFVPGSKISGRWSANGPNMAKLFHDLHAGFSFIDPNLLPTDPSFKIDRTLDQSKAIHARAGDFAKLFWNDRIGEHELGHSVIFKEFKDGVGKQKGQKLICFWSSNTGTGYGDKCVLKSKVKLAIFSRFDPGSGEKFAKNLSNLLANDNKAIDALANGRDTYLRSMQTLGKDVGHDITLAEVRRKTGLLYPGEQPTYGVGGEPAEAH